MQRLEIFGGATPVEIGALCNDHMRSPIQATTGETCLFGLSKRNFGRPYVGDATTYLKR